MNSVLMTNVLIISAVIAIAFGIAMVIACLINISRNLNILIGLVSMAIQKSDLVRTQEEVESDMEEATRTMEEEMEFEEVPRHEIPADADKEDLTF